MERLGSWAFAVLAAGVGIAGLTGAAGPSGTGSTGGTSGTGTRSMTARPGSPSGPAGLTGAGIGASIASGRATSAAVPPLGTLRSSTLTANRSRLMA